jgi:uncharacterized protein YndB with AHSA1/START domain
MKTLPYKVDRDILIEADRETVFGFFTDSARWASWWGTGSTVDPRPRESILHPGAVDGECWRSPPERICHHVRLPEAPYRRKFPRDDSSEVPRVAFQLLHEFGGRPRDEHQGWRFQLSLFGNVVANLRQRRSVVNGSRLDDPTAARQRSVKIATAGRSATDLAC